MNTMKFIIGLVFAVESVMALNWTTMKLDVSATLRAQKRGVLEKVTKLPKGTVFKYAKSVGSRKFRSSNGRVKNSRSGWYRFIMIKSVPGVGRKRINQLNKKTLFISKSITAGLSKADIKRTNIEDKPRVAHSPGTRLTKSVTSCRSSFISKGVPVRPMDLTLKYFAKNKRKFKNQRFVSFTDFSKPFKQKRYFLLDLQSCKVSKEFLAHGSGNGPRGMNAKPNRCKNAKGTRTQTSRPGFAKVQGYHWRNQNNPKKSWTYITNKRPKKQALSMSGLERRNNDLSSKGVVTHETKSSGYRTGTYRSYGCPVMSPGRLKSHQSVLRKGTLYFNYIPRCE